MKTFLITILLMTVMLQPKPVRAQLAIAQVIKSGVKKVIKAIDLKVQRLQNQTIWLQNAQKTLENAMSKGKLGEISAWTERQRDLYQEYFAELSKVKQVVSYYHQVKSIGASQIRLVGAYRKTWQLLKKDTHFSTQELEYMAKVYAGILKQSSRQIDQLILVIDSFQTRMSDAARLELIRQVSTQTDQGYFDLLSFNQQNISLSLSRAREQTDLHQIKQLYGLQ
ncbi:conjugal transfer protein TraI [Pedobacter foliorum]|uniref:conjugal transfer protein TraI n=1 Tax=Pedobacter foliorum TaxID=2739058 RepID=UPI0015675927|nr:conjugal transfer protein TraI [Pedobacter foliorum]NRF41105.1 conjugal transfer protein TraI [Pedobacter foliorum]